MNYVTNFYSLFPTLVMCSHYDKPKSIKTSVADNILNHVDANGMAGEASGNVLLHLDAAFDELFEFAITSAKKFISGYKIDPNTFDYSIVKTWANVLNDCSTPPHHHRDAHISFCYYVNVPEDQNMAITFYDHEYKHEPFAQMLRCNEVTDYIPANSTSWYFDILEGQIMVFPSSLAHGVNSQKDQVKVKPEIKTKDDFYRHRVSIAGDIILTHKNLTTHPSGLQPLKNWRTFK